MKKKLEFKKETVSSLNQFRGGDPAGTRSICGEVNCPVMTVGCPTSAGCPTNGCDITTVACRTMACPTQINIECLISDACDISIECPTVTGC